MKKYNRWLCRQCTLLFLLAFVSYNAAFGQESIGGATCIAIGTQYSYTMSGAAPNFTYSVSGGTLSTGGTTGNCSTTSTSVLITWTGAGSLTMTSEYGNNSISVTVKPSLAAGTLTSGQTQSITTGNTPAAIFCSAATGGDCVPTYAYQWQQSPNNVSYTNISGQTAQNISFSTGLTATTYYRRMVTVAGSTGYSNVATVNVYPVLNPGSVSPVTQTINYGANASVLTVSGVSGGTNSYNYQWQSSTDGITFYTISGATATTYTPAALTTTTYFNVIVTSSNQSLATSYVTVLVNPQLLPGVISPANIPVTSGNSPGIINGTAASYGSCSGSYSYQWYSSANGTSFTLISGATSQNYTPDSLTANTWFTRKVTCSTTSLYSDTAEAVIVSGTSDMNFVRVRDITKQGVLDSASALALTSTYDVAQTTQYFDGLGRPIETVAMQQSPLQKDLVSFNIYDPLGREATKYLPYVATTNDGNYKPTPLADGSTFNASQFSGEQYYYSQTNYEPSPLNRVSTTYAPGTNWVGSGRGVSAQYSVNTLADSVRYWKIAFVPGSIPTTMATYAAGTLYENSTTDEAGHSVVEYKDIEGKVILKKVQIAATPGTAHVGWLCTYYIYDDLNNLRFVIQPDAVQLINSNWTITTVIASELCFRYEYDYRKRMIIKKIPGAGESWMVYDLRDRLVMSQDSSLRLLHKWMFIMYDSENRPDSTGLITDPTNYNNLTYHQNLAANSIAYPNVASYTNELLTFNHYDDYAGLPSGLTSSLNNTYINSTNFTTTYNTSPNYEQAITPLYITRGLPTWSQVKVLGTTSQFMTKENFYDDRGRLIQTQAINQSAGEDIATTQYGFSGKLLQSHFFHQKSTTPVQSYQYDTKNLYDAGGRVTEIDKNWNTIRLVRIATMTYNELGQLKTKGFGRNPYNTSLPIETLNYDYNK